ncbi:methionyl-tRNA formyltransferase [Alicyclobacillus dauci]|uniref:Methionyl-tRNA formyltransferase n=1 Tax=Alicyclobacillus dauci TaxID=1475485 RepID=A0ABY6YYI7_9BACL|nr:methionyl-tRNA formyltransferase [Alicyclobacillus dauci]WAH35497.1 methionyl-tRNA formyltransferase [Alicyclobacillus dauci]
MTVKVVFMGTPDFAVPTLDALVAQGWDVLVVTQPDRKVGRKRELTPPPVKIAALRHGLTVLQPDRVRQPEVIAKLEAFQPDLLVTAAYGQLLPQAVLDLPANGAVNMHASLLPRWRGAAPIHRAIMAGDESTGVTLMEMVQALDAGPIVAVREIPILDTDDVGTLHDKLAALGAEMVQNVLPAYIAGTIDVTPQPDEGVTYAARIERKDEFISWNRPAKDVLRHIRGLSPWPGASGSLDDQDIKIWSAEISTSSMALRPGEVGRHGGSILVGCQDGTLVLGDVQPAGKRKMNAVDWFSGLRRDRVQLLEGQSQ